MSDTNMENAAEVAEKEEEMEEQTHFEEGRRESEVVSSGALAQKYEDDDNADDEDYLYHDLSDDDGESPGNSGSEEEGYSNTDEGHSNERSSTYSVHEDDEPINCDELYNDLENEIVETREVLRVELEAARQSAMARKELRLEKKRQLMNTYMMYQDILRRIKKERDYLEDHIYQFLARRELTIKTEIKMTKDKKSRAERKLDLEWSKRLKDHRQRMDMKIAQKKIKKLKEAAEKDRKRKMIDLKTEEQHEEEDVNIAAESEVVVGKQVEIIAKPDRKLQFSTSVFKLLEAKQLTKEPKKEKKDKRKTNAKAKQRKAERQKAKEIRAAEKKDKKDHKPCAKKNPIDNPYARQMQLLAHFTAQSEQSSIRNAKRLAEHQELIRVKREEIVEKRRILRRNERERKIILRIMRFLYPEVMERIRSQKSDIPVLKFDRKKRLRAIQAKKLRGKKRAEKEPEPTNSRKKRLEVKIAKILKKTLEKRSKVNVSAAHEEYEKVLKRILQLRLFWIECGKENEIKLNKISRRSEITETKNKQLFEELLVNIRDVSENAFYSSSLKKIPKAETNQFCNEIHKMHQKMLESSLKRHKLSKAVKVAQRQLKETQPKKRGRNDVQLLYEQFKADNQILDGKLKSKNETRDRMEKNVLQVVESLAHFKEKIKFVQERLAASKNGYADLTQSVYRRRDTLANIMLEYVDTKRNERGLNAEYGILQSSRMLQDLDDTRMHCEKLRDEERNLRRDLAKRHRELSNIKYQMEIMQAKSDEIKSLAMKMEKENELQKYKQKMQEELAKAARRHQRMHALDTGFKGKHSIQKSTPVAERTSKSNVSLQSEGEEEEEEYLPIKEINDEDYIMDPYFMGGDE